MRRIWLLSAVSLTVAWNSPAKADFATGLIDVDFKFTNDLPNMTGPAVIGSVGDIWNSDLNFFAHTTGVLNLATGSPSNGVSYSLSGTTNAVIGAGGPPGATFMSDGYIVSPGNTMMISVNGLTPFQPYDLYFYSSFVYPPSTDIRMTTFTIAGTGLTATSVGFPGAFVEGNNYAHFSSKQADASGRLSVTIQGSGGLVASGSDLTGGIVNGFQITPVPEPAAMALFAVGGLGVLIVACCRRKL